METKIEPFLKDVVDPMADKGERWKVGERAIGTPKKETEAKADSLGIKTTSKGSKRKRKKIGVYLRLRRCPTDVHQAIGANYRSERDKKDGSTEYYFEPDDFEEFMAEKARWMWLDTENMVIEIDEEPKTVALYNRAFANDNGSPKLKGGEVLIMDGHWNDEIREHFVKRYKWLRVEIMKAAYQYEQSDSYKEEMLKGNL